LKAVIVGAAGVRTPYLIKAIWQKRQVLNVDSLTMMDIDAKRLGLLETVVLEMIDDPEFPITATTDPREALADAGFVIFTIRVGGMEARAVDEQVPLKYDVLGQETTGPGGFAMAMRTIPVILNYMKILEEVAPNAWAINLTNPAGLITQAITASGFKRVIGICDTPSELFKDVARGMEIPLEELWFEYFGINHLGWIKRVLHRGRDISQEVLANDKALLRHGDSMLDPDFIRSIGMIPNEYLMFYYRNRSIIDRVKANRITRATMIEELNDRLFVELERLGQAQPGASLKVYEQYSRARDASYMKIETSDLSYDNMLDALWEEAKEAPASASEEPEGYAGIALAVLEGIFGNSPQIVIVNTLNHGAVSCLDPDDVVELPSYVDLNGVHPLAVSAIPEESRGLLQIVKNYERLTIQAVKENSYQKALQALTVHPLVPDAEIAGKILDDFMVQHAQHFPELK